LSAGGNNVLLVDDDPIQLVLRAEMLQKAGFIPVSATTAAQALAFLGNAPSGAFDLVITDHSLDDSTGPVLVRRMRALQPALPVIVFTGYPDVEHEYAGLDVFFEVKPSSPPALLALVRQITQRPIAESDGPGPVGAGR
jgi:DNA-binding response OmpR family regulator